MRTAQELFETSLNALRKQGYKSHQILSTKEDGSSEYTCRYRSEDGCKCAIGWLIPDELYDSKIEGKLVGELVTYNLLPVALVSEFHRYLTLLMALQNIHDRKPIHEWEKHWRMLADDFRLKYTI